MTEKIEQASAGVASVLNAETIHKLRAEVKRLHEVIKQEAEYHHKAAFRFSKSYFHETRYSRRASSKTVT